MRALPFLLTVCLLLPLDHFAQSPAPNPAAAWQLTGMQGEAVVVLFHPDSAYVQKESRVARFRIVRKPGVVRLSDKKEDAQVLSLLGIGATPIAETYGPDTQNLLATEKLLTAAARLPDNKLLLEGSGGLPTQGPDTALAQEETANGTKQGLEGNSPWLYAGIAAVLALIAGWMAGRASRGKATQPLTASQTKAAIGEAANTSTDKSADLKTALRQAQQELLAIQTDDRQLFSGAFDKLVLPLQASLEQADKERTIALLAEGAAMLASITRHKLAKKGKHDDANLRLLTGTAQTAPDLPVITGITPPDQMPQNLRALVALLKENGVSGLDGVLVQGYEIKDL